MSQLSLYTPQNVETLGTVNGLRLGELSRFTAVEASWTAGGGDRSMNAPENGNERVSA